MADDENDTATPRLTQREEKQVAQLKREINKINRTLVERVEQVAEEATGWYASTAERAGRAAQVLRTKASSVSDVVHDNPVMAPTVFIVVGTALAGLLVGLALRDWDRRFRR
ncbi:hypothetical protein DBIPINDM_008558 (plasmid) [Mesorhizobium sp. AR02]|uniref:hypothetical protein n=1 Tax=Mesorhizobium sp. AR02 TaxID=2865837 RepID=UPI00215E6E41|nr:hypothetical protein [Mesorhizobium sp. AR02]UVK57297.1 hypothetical protein DBIPINDM_008558 [Mesorhizobium sp. AR02]